MKFYLALDGTADVTQRERAERAALVGPDCAVCLLPAGKDPDDLSAEELASIKGESRPALTEWLTLVEALPGGSERESSLARLRPLLKGWCEKHPARAADWRAEICSTLGWTDAEYAAWLGKVGRASLPVEKTDDDNSSNSTGTEARPTPAQPEPLGPAPVGDDKKKWITNFVWQKRDVKNSKGVVEKKNMSIAKPIDQIRAEVWDALNKWPCRIGGATASASMLFVDPGNGKIRFVEAPAAFAAMLHEYATLKFMRGQDMDKTNFLSQELLFESFCGSEYVTEWEAAEFFPHEPPIDKHYYAWRAPADYVPTGEHLAKLIGFFDNVEDPACRAILAAAFVTPFWGGPLGKRPAFLFQAKIKGSGKTTAAEMVAGLCGGALSLSMDRRSEERVKERLLSPDAAAIRCPLLDNAKGEIDSALLEELMTCKVVSGKRLGIGEGRRPNTLVYLITGNNVRLSSDVTRRVFFIDFVPPKKTVEARVSWERQVLDYTQAHGEKIVADCVMILQGRAPLFSWGDLEDETFALWASEVLARVLGHPLVFAAVGEIDPLAVLRRNHGVRTDTDSYLQEAKTFLQGLLERLCDWNNYFLDAITKRVPEKPIFIRTEPPSSTKSWSGMTDEERAARKLNMVDIWKEVFTRDEISSKWLAERLDDHIEAGRLPGVSRWRKSTGRGFLLDHNVVIEYVERKALEEKSENDASYPSQA